MGESFPTLFAERRTEALVHRALEPLDIGGVVGGGEPPTQIIEKTSIK